MNVHYERLSNLDASFFALETRTTHMHVGGVATFHTGSLALADGGIDMAAIERHIESKLHLIPRYRQHLAWVPLERHPVWVDDDHFNLDYHVRHTSLPRPGTVEQLKALAGRLMSQGLDRNKPLWELYVVEGLEDGRFALISKIHHAMIDGLSGVDLMAVLLGFAPSEEIEEPPPWEPRPAPNGTELFIRETSRRISTTLASAAKVHRLPGHVGDLTGQIGKRLQAVGASLSSGWLMPTGRTPINGPVGPNRRFDWLEIPLAEVKAIKNSLGGTVNDVLLAVVAGAVRSFLIEERQMDPAEVWGLEYRAMAPVSVRTENDRGTLGNQVAMWLVSLPVGESDPHERLRRVAEQTQHLKESNQALGASTIVSISSGAPSTLVGLGARLAANVRPFNLTVTNVPGPQFPLYLLGARMESTYPLVPLWESHGVGLAMFSYDARVCWGINGDFDLLADIDRFAGAIERSFRELLKAAENLPDDAEPGAKRKPKKRPPLGAS